MRILFIPDPIILVADQAVDELVMVTHLTGWTPAGLQREPGFSIVLEPNSHCSLALGYGVYAFDMYGGDTIRILLPQGIWLSARATRELLRHPDSAPAASIMPSHIARAMTDILRAGQSWAIATRVLGLGPRGEFPGGAQAPDSDEDEED